MKASAFLLWLCLCGYMAMAQETDPYHLNGSATQDNCNCYTLTPDQLTQSGSVWNKTEIDLTQSFDYSFNVYLGCKDLDGADGIVFVLQPISTSVGTTGQGLGFFGVTPSIGIPIDTYQNVDFDDPSYDHIGIYRDGDLHNNSPNVLAPPVQVLPDNGNIEDCQWHVFRIHWDALAKNLSAYIDGFLRVQTNLDLVKDIFGGRPLVFWGFSGATGGSSNVQKFCTSLNPGYSVGSNQKTCFPTPIQFDDSSTSFGTILHWYWDFGDGTTLDQQTPPPHNYPAPGIYNVKLNILANNGCLSDTFMHKIVIGSIPKAGFAFPAAVCTVQPTLFTDRSTVEFGTINEWDWTLNPGGSLQNTYGGLAQTFAEGPEQISLVTRTVEGCVSDPYSINFNVYPKPAATASFVDAACYGAPLSFSAQNINTAVRSMNQWVWDFGDSSQGNGDPVSHLYPAGGSYHPSVYGISNEGCHSDTAIGNTIIYQSIADAGRDTVITLGQSLQLQGGGGTAYRWFPAEGLSDPGISDPVTVIRSDISYTLEASTSFGCPTYDTIHIKTYVGPDIYVPNGFTPDHNGRNDRFHPVMVGITRLFYFQVYNRYGQLIYHSENDGDGWDGNFQGQAQPAGTYVWMIKGLDYNGLVHAKQGTVVLIR